MIARVTLPGLLLLLAACGHRNDEATVRDPDTTSRLHIAETASASGQTEIALSMYSAAAASAPDSVEAQSKFASELLRVGKPEIAEQVLTKALARRPNDPALLRWRGVLLLQTGDANGAEQIFDKLLSRNKADLGALNGRGMALDLVDRHDEAEQAYRTALAISANDIQSSNNLAISLLLADRAAEARDILLSLSQRLNVPPRVLNNLAVAQAAAGDVGGSNARLAGKPGAEDFRALAAAFGAPALQDDPAVTPASARIPRAGGRPAG